MNGAEISLLMATGPAARMLRNPWRYKGFHKMSLAFLENQYVIMGREAWFDFPYKDDTSFTPWIISSNQRFQLRTRATHGHVFFTDDLSLLDTVLPPKGIWWILGGFQLYRSVLPRCHSVETVVVSDAIGAVDLLSAQNFVTAHQCINPYDRKQKCVRYERAKISKLSMQKVQSKGVC